MGSLARIFGKVVGKSDEAAEATARAWRRLRGGRKSADDVAESAVDAAKTKKKITPTRVAGITTAAAVPATIWAGVLGRGPLGRIFDNGPSVAEGEQDLSWANLFPQGAPVSQADKMREFYNQMQGSYQSAPGIDYTGIAQEANRREADNLNKYLAEIGGYTDEQSDAMRRAYNELSGRSQLLGQAEETEALQTGAGIENIYRNLIGAQAADTGDTGEFAGLTGVSGEMATGGDVTGTQARTLVDYLGREGGGARASLEELAIQQQQQGLGSAADLATMARLSEAQARRGLGEREASRLAEADLQAQADARQEALRRLEFDQQMQQQIFGAELADLQTQQTEAATNRAIVAQVGSLLRSDPNKSQEILRDFGSVNTFLNVLSTRPELAYYYGLIAG